MPVVPLNQVSSRIRVGAPLPWDVLNQRGDLLLSKGQVLDDSQARNRLLARGSVAHSAFAGLDTTVSALEASAPPEPASQPTSTFFDKFRYLQGRVIRLLQDPTHADFIKNTHIIAATLKLMAKLHSDQLIFSLLSPDTRGNGPYGASHALHVASICALLLPHLEGESLNDTGLLMAALTMNVSITGLQTTLAGHSGPLSPEHRAGIHRHPHESAALLMDLGVQDEAWLRAVAEHHELPGGTGYPANATNPSDASQLLRLTDAFAAMHSPRVARPALSPKAAAQSIYRQTNGDAIASLVVKEFGIYPPSTLVQLANSEQAIVVKRGKHLHTPLVCVLMNKDGEPVMHRKERDTALPQFAIVRQLTTREVRRCATPEELFPG